jgi:hypothetical protein
MVYLHATDERQQAIADALSKLAETARVAKSRRSHAAWKRLVASWRSANRRQALPVACGFGWRSAAAVSLPGQHTR